MKSNSWFVDIKTIMFKYDLELALNYIENPMKKEHWGKLVKTSSARYWIDVFRPQISLL